MTLTRHAPGTFCWTELATSDGPAASEFYTHLFGWETHDDPLPSGGIYTMLKLNGKNLGALYALTEEMREQGGQPAWLGYVSVEDAYATEKIASGLGGKVIKEAFDVFDIGSMAVLQEPTGATFAIWQPRLHTGSHFKDGRPGTVCWNELASRDAKLSGDFYRDLLGWQPVLRDMGEIGHYTVFTADGEEVAGMLQMSEEWGDLPSHWMTYFAVEDCDLSAQRARELGGKICVPPTDLPPTGRFAVIDDPQGAVFSIIKRST